MGDTSIEWTEKTWNPVAGCSVVSPGCHHCYARNIAARFSAPGAPYHGLAVMTEHGPQWTGEMRLVTKHLADPLRWRAPARVFVNSMSDLFHEGLTNEQIAAVFGVMAAAPRHTYQVLTKRAKRMREWFEWIKARAADADSFPVGVCQAYASQHLGRSDLMPELLADWPSWPLPSVWIGVSVEDQKRADERVPELLRTPAAVRFISYEPALGHVDFGDAIYEQGYESNGPQGWVQTREHGIDWVIVGGESGPGSRPFDVAWARDVVRQCREARVACFVKQMGAKPIEIDDGTRKAIEIVQGWGHDTVIVGANRLALKNRKGNDMAEWPEDLRVREFPEVGA
jgi:protein gp37